MNLKEKLEKYRREKKQKRWRGTLDQYLEEKVKHDPDLSDLSHARVWKMIIRAGVKIVSDELTLKRHGRPVEAYELFNDFYGVKVKEEIEGFVEDLKQAAMRGEASRQVFYLKGPVGSGKSSLVARIMEGLENEGIYAIEGCRQQDNPLLLIPRGLRKEYEKEYKLNRPIEGDICPNCRFRLLEQDKLLKYYTEDGEIKEKYKKKGFIRKKLFEVDGTPIWKNIVKHQKFKYRDENGNVLFGEFPVKAIRFSKRARKGLVSLPPIDPNSQDIGDFIGVENISRLHELAPGDPRLVMLIGAFNASNRGILELIEIFENDREYLRSLLTATQEKLIMAPGKQQMIYWDGLIIGHSNPPQWERFKSDPENVNYIDRILLRDFPYPLELDEEIKVYKKKIAEADYRNIHIAPFALEIPAILALFSRYKEDDKLDLLIKLKAYTEGEVIVGRGEKIFGLQLRDKFPEEGSFGLSNRFTRKNIIDRVAVKSKHNCIDPIAIFEMAIRAVKEADLPKDTKAKYLGWLQSDIIQEYKKFLAEEIVKHGRETFEREMDKLFQAYRKNAEIFVKRIAKQEQSKGSPQPGSPNQEGPKEDSKVLELVEQVLGLSGMARGSFRKDFVKFVRAKERKGEKVNWNSFPQMKEGLEEILVSSPKALQMVFEKGEKEISENMVKKGNHCKHCVKIALEFAKNNLWRD